MNKTYSVIKNTENPIIVTVIIHNYLLFPDLDIFMGYTLESTVHEDDMHFTFVRNSISDKLYYERAMEILSENDYQEISK